ncbi:hypothetical protein [Halalkalicoccus salilacus]|uniref:hypothetical protein n=1 Tax=Halalkalicoccus salilacus TaxID=3117459 RepID=UPI00300EEEA7
MATRNATIATQKETSNTYSSVRRLAFYAVVLVGTLIPIAVFGPFLAFPLLGWFDPALAQNTHFLHDLAFIGLVLVGVIGMATQLYKPKQHIAGLQQTLIVFGAFLATMAGITLAGDPEILAEAPFFAILFGPAVVAALLHPAGRKLLRTRMAGRFSPVLAGIVMVAAIPLAMYAFSQFGLHWSGDEHAVINHYAGMVVYTSVIIALGILASLKPAGWRIPLYSAAGLAVMLGVASVLYSTIPSGVGTTWGAAAVVWAVAFVVAGEMSARRGDDTRRVASDPDARMG